METYLKQLYEKYNKSYFDGLLPGISSQRVMIQLSRRLTATGGFCRRVSWGRDYKYILTLSHHYLERFPEDVENLLLHEMIHILVRGHGQGFQRWMAYINSFGIHQVNVHAKGRAKKPEYKWLYICPNGACDLHIVKKTVKRYPNDGQGYACKKCRTQIVQRRI